MKIKSVICVLILLLCSFFAFSALPSFVDESYEAYYLDDDFQDDEVSTTLLPAPEFIGKPISKEARGRIKRVFNNLYNHQKIAGEYSTDFVLPTSITGGLGGIDGVAGKFAIIDFENALVDLSVTFNVLGVPFDLYLHTIGINLRSSKLYKNYNIDKNGSISFSSELLKNKEAFLADGYVIPKMPFFEDASAFDALGLGLALAYFEEVGQNKYSCIFSIDEDFENINDFSDLIDALSFYKPSNVSQAAGDAYVVVTFTTKGDEIDTLSLKLCNMDVDDELANYGIKDSLSLNIKFTAFDDKALSKNLDGEYVYLPRTGSKAR